MTPNPKAVLAYNNPLRPRDYLEQIEYGYLRLLESIDKHSAGLTQVRESLEGEAAELVGEIIADLATILGRNVNLRHKVQATINDRLLAMSQK